jgi:hypothetical protein
VAATFFFGGFVVDLHGHRATHDIALYEEFEGMMARQAKIAAIVPAGTKCHVVRINMKILINFHIWCGGLNHGWTEQGGAFEPPMDSRKIFH